MAMKKNETRRLIEKSRKTIIVSTLAAVISASLFLFSRTNIGSSANFYIANRLEYGLREYFKKDPDINSNLKIFGFDDKTLASYQRGELTFEDWAKIIDGLAAQKPKAILIDQIFSIIPSTEAAGLAKFKAALERADNVSAVSFVHDYMITKRVPIDYDLDIYRLETYSKDDPESIQWMRTVAPNVYGPHPDIRGSFKYIGHALYPGMGRIDPFIRIGKNAVIPHIGLFSTKDINVTASSLHLHGQKVDLDSNGRIPLNFSSTTKYYKATYPVAALFKDVTRTGTTDLVKEGDIVLIIPGFFTGHLDVLEGATGRIPGGFILAALLNSIESGAWLTTFDHSGIFIISLTLLGILLGIRTTAITFWPLLTGSFVVIFGGSLALFIFLGVQVSWFYPLAAFLLCSTSCFGINMVERMLETQKLKDALKGAVPEAKLREIISNKGRLHLDASERVVTLMFLDIANFSVISEQQSAKDTFLFLKSTLKDVTKTIHKYGGTVDRTLGDGILCFFGYSFDGEISENQADQAIKCAIEIQKQNIERCIKSTNQGLTGLPFRIGLNTSSVYIGDIGNEDRIDFTVIGNGVNYAQRLESACDHHSVMISGTTMDFSSSFNAKMPGFKKRFINIKHHDELIESTEYNPFHDTPEKVTNAQQAFRKSNNLERKEQRWPIADNEKLKVETEFGTATMVDFSSSGFCIQIGYFLSKGVILDINLVFNQPELKVLAADFGIDSIKAEVRWGKVSGKGFCHGVKITNLSTSQLENLFQFLRSTFNRNAADDIQGAV
jgi:class 3 adenylate cyclase